MLRLMLSLVLLALVGCAWLWGPWPVHPVTTGYHSTSARCGTVTPIRQTYVVWSSHPGVSQYLTGMLLQMQISVVERARVEQLFDEQKFRLLNTSEREADLLRVGQMAGATHVLFAEVSTNPRSVTEAYGYTMSVSVRSVYVETGEVCWSGTASTPDRIMSPVESSAITGAYWAMARALCLVEAGWQWVEPTGQTDQGCLPPAVGSPAKRGSERPIWRDLEATELQQAAAQLNATKRAFDQEKADLDRAKAALDREKAVMDGNPDARARMLPHYEQRVAEHNRRVADYEQRVADHNRRVADWQRQIAEHNQRGAPAPPAH